MTEIEWDTRPCRSEECEYTMAHTAGWCGKPQPLRFVSYGGGVQSTALLVLAAQGRIDFRTFVMANVGDDSENPATLVYVRDVAAPYAAAHGLELHVIDRVRRDGTVETLWGRLMKEDSKSLPIPVRMDNGAPGTRSCTADFKIKVTGKWAKQQGATAGRRCAAHKRDDEGYGRDLGPRTDCAKCVQPRIATIGIGISLDEIERANTRKSSGGHERVVYPLVGIGEETGLSLTRQDCRNIITRAGLPVPPKSSCFFCPFHRPAVWDDMRRDEPELFERAAHLEDTLNARRARLGKDPVYLTRFAKPLRVVARDDQELLPLFADGGACDSGWCMT